MADFALKRDRADFLSLDKFREKFKNLIPEENIAKEVIEVFSQFYSLDDNNSPGTPLAVALAALEQPLQKSFSKLLETTYKLKAKQKVQLQSGLIPDLVLFPPGCPSRPTAPSTDLKTIKSKVLSGNGILRASTSW